MGGERASTTRQREAGRICAVCSTPLPDPPQPAPQQPGERRCAWCLPNAPIHRVLLTFMHRQGWHVAFLERDCQTSLRRQFTFRDPARILELARRGGCPLDDTLRSAFAHDVEIGRGGLWLNLTRAQYLKLK